MTLEEKLQSFKCGVCGVSRATNKGHYRVNGREYMCHMCTKCKGKQSCHFLDPNATPEVQS